MGKFSGILICSDIDGTVISNSDYEGIFKKNSQAVKYFIENGGKFTFATGRYAFYLESKEFKTLINAPACVFNGAVVYDYDSRKIMREKRICHPLSTLIGIADGFKDSLVRVTASFDANERSVNDLTDSMLNEYTDNFPLKCIYVFDSEKHADQFKAGLLADKNFDDCYVSKSWNIAVEMTDINATKGDAVQFIKTITHSHTLVTIGDYENDVPMIQAADIGVAVGSALPSVKKAADVTVCSFDDGAVFELIDLLDKKFI